MGKSTKFEMERKGYVNITDHEAELRAFAAPSSSGLVMSGRIEFHAGKKKPCNAAWMAVRT